MSIKLTEELRNEINQIPVIDGHEHIRNKQNLITEGVHLFSNIKYSIGWMDLISCGMPPDYWLMNSGNPKYDWKKLEPYMDRVMTTGTFTTLMTAYRDLYGFKDKEITKDNWQELSAKLTETYQKKDWYEIVLRKKLNIDKILIDVVESPGSLDIPGSPDLFVPSLAMDPFLFVKSEKFYSGFSIFNPGGGWFPSDPCGRLLRSWGVYYETFEDYISLIDLAYQKLRAAGGVAIKLRFAYRRDMKIDKVSKQEAEKVFNMDEEDITRTEATKLENYICRTIIQKAMENDIAVQVHTGFLGDMGNTHEHGNPLQLNNLFQEYAKARFVLFHGGYPWAGETCALLKGFPNVYADLCFMPWLMHNTLKNYLSEILTLVSNNKIMIGGDCETVERCYSAMTCAKDCMASVLADFVQEDTFNKEMAVKVAKRVFRENGLFVYRIKG
jgi:predicted TIM-barrel fold metal-dependent hydrolase